MTIHKEIEIIIDWENIVTNILRLERLGYTNITKQMQEKEYQYISFKKMW